MDMKKIIAVLLTMIVLTALTACNKTGTENIDAGRVDNNAFRLIPAPQKITAGKNYTVVAPTVGGGVFENAQKTLCDFTKRIHGTVLTQVASGAAIVFEKTEGLKKEAYRIKAAGGKLTVSASDEAGAQNAVATIVQMEAAAEGGLKLPECDIKDEPDCEFRAVMVDLARAWHEPHYIYEYIDMCRFYKIRYLQLHFTDSQLYTLPSKAFPKLSTPGSSYTEEEIKGFIEYARLRGVSLIPEIEAPGHCGIFQAKYPAVFGSDGIICQGAASLEAMEAIFSELCELFEGSEYIHLGGDEANIALWLKCKKCLATYRSADPDFDRRTDDEKLAIMYSGYINRISEVVFRHGMKPIVWEGFPEEANKYVSKDILVYSWENYYQTAPSLLKAGFNIVNASWSPMYIVTPAAYWTPQEIYEWSIYRWKAVHPQSPYNQTPLVIDPDPHVRGGMLLAWGDHLTTNYKKLDKGIQAEQRLIEERVPFLAYNTWNLDSGHPGYEDFYDQTVLPVKTLYENLIKTRSNYNLALNASVFTHLNDCYEEYGNAVANLTDGNRSTQFCSTLLAEFDETTYDWIRVDLGAPKEVNQVALFPVFDSNLGRYYMFPKDYEVQLSADGAEWKTVAKVTDYTCDTDKVVHDFDTETARYVRIYVTRVDKSVHETPMWFVYLKEFEVSYIA